MGQVAPQTPEARTLEKRRPAWRRSDWLFVLLAALALALYGVFTFFGDAAVVSPVEFALAMTVLGVALLFGVSAAIVALAAAGLLTIFLAHGLITPDPLTVPQIAVKTLFAVAVIVTGWLAEERRRRPAEPVAPNAAVHTLQTFLRTFVSRRGIMAGAALFTGFLLSIALPWPTGSILRLVPLVSGLLIAAILYRRARGVAIGLCAGGLTVAVAELFNRGSASPFWAAIRLMTLGGVGWWLESLTVRLRQLETAVVALSGITGAVADSDDEADIRRLAAKGFAELFPGELEFLEEQAVANMQAQASKDVVSFRRVAFVRSASGDFSGAVAWTPGENLPAWHSALGAILMDHTAAALARTQLSEDKASLEMASRSEHLRTIILDAVSHHFRSPLAAIVGSVTSILGQAEPHDPVARRELLGIIKEQATRLSRYVSNFLSVARLESGALEVNAEAVRLESFLYDVWESFGASGSGRRFFRMDVPEEVVVRADPALLTQVFGNIFENAIKYSPEGSHVDVVSRLESSRIIIEITDEGAGVPPSQIPHIFGRFYRARGNNAPGLGLGLYITRSLVMLQGGDIAARNRTDGRSGFAVAVALPLATELE